MALHNPQISYEKDRKENGMPSIMEKKENREIYKGVQYCKYRYRRGNGEDVLVYLIIVSPHAPAKLAVSAAPLGTVKMVKRHACEFDGYVICAVNAGYFHFFNDGDLTPPVSLPGKFHGQRSLAGYHPWGCERVGHDLATKQH